MYRHISHKDRQCRYSVKKRRFRATTVVVEKQKYYIFWVCVSNYSNPSCNEHSLYRHLLRSSNSQLPLVELLRKYDVTVATTVSFVAHT